MWYVVGSVQAKGSFLTHSSRVFQNLNADKWTWKIRMFSKRLLFRIPKVFKTTRGPLCFFYEFFDVIIFVSIWIFLIELILLSRSENFISNTCLTPEYKKCWCLNTMHNLIYIGLSTRANISSASLSHFGQKRI
jgi:hypothetical protein